MATVREGTRSVLLVVDVQVGVMSQLWESAKVIENLSRAVAQARAQSVPIVWIRHTASYLPEGSPEWQLVPQLVPAEGEHVIDKDYNSAFEETTLDRVLAELGATHIVLGGAATSWCIRATAYGALDRGYDLTLIEDAHTTADMDAEDGSTIPAGSVIHELNVVMDWLSYPNRKSASAKLAEIDFAGLSDSA